MTNWNLRQSIPPYALPVSVTECKRFMSIPAGDQAWDTLIGELIPGAVERVERDSRRQLIASTWKLTLDNFYPEPPRGNCGILDYEIRLGSPLCGVTSITYVDTGGTTQTLSSSNYSVDTERMPGRVAPVWGQQWPTTREVQNAATITFTLGHAAPFTADSSTDILTVSGRTFTNGDFVRLSNTGGALPTGLSTLTDYYVIGVSGQTLQLSLTSGGSAVNFTDSGTGTHFLGVVPNELQVAVKRIVGVRFEYREADDKAEEIERAISCITAGLWTGEMA